jgi:YYY domain-containing protein
MSEAIRWWLILQLVGIVLLPLCLALFRRLPDRGYALSKPFGLFFTGYAFWFLNSIHLLPNSNGGVIGALLLLGLISGAFAYREREGLLAWGRKHWRYVVGVEVLFVVVFAIAVYLRSLVGQINGTEQPMDLMFVNAVTAAGHFPPKDPWLSGETVAYYYFGYLLVAITGRLAGVPTDVAYNIGLAMIAAMALVGAAGLVYNLVQMRESAASGGASAGEGAGARPTRRKSAARAGSASHYATLGVGQRTADAEIDRAYQRLTAKLQPAAGAGDAAASARLRDAKAAYAVLSDPEQRRLYDAGDIALAGEPGDTGEPVTEIDAPIAYEAPPSAPRQQRRVYVQQPPAGTAATRGWRAPVFGVAGGLMLVVMGNLVWVLAFASSYGIGSKSFYEWVNVSGLNADEPRHSWYPSRFFLFFNASRIYPLDHKDFRAITEFPMFSFILGDMHPHVMALPFVLLVVAAALTLYRSPEPLDITFWIQRPLALIAGGLLIGGLAFLNTWDIATLAFVIVAAAFVSNFMRVRAITVDLFVQIVSFALPLLILAIVLYLPFYLSFTSQADGIGAVVSNQGITVPATRPFHAFLFWGPLLVIVVPFVAARLIALRTRITPLVAAIAAAPAVAVVAGWALLFLYEKAAGSGKLGAGAGGLGTQITDRGTAWLTSAFIASVLAAALAALWLELTARDERPERESPIFALLLVATAMLLILGTEFFYVGDVFNSRMNTVFKLYYQAWMLLAIAGGFSLYYLTGRWRAGFPNAMAFRWVWGIGAAAVLVGAALYPLGGGFNRTHDENGTLAESNGALHGIHHYSQDERAAIDWLNDRADGQDLVIAEAVGNDYTLAGRISGATGVPAIMGWKGHEDQWRSGNCKPCLGRFEDVVKIYSAPDVASIASILKKYDVTYIYVGDLERKTYGDAGLAKFKTLPVAFQSGAVTIYRAKGVTGEVEAAP